LGQEDRMVEVVIQDQGTEPDPCRVISDGQEWRQGRPTLSNMIRGVKYVEARILGGTGL
jgi:hypothetical protein